MNMGATFFKEVVDAQGQLVDMEVSYPSTFNFGYDVIDVMAQESPEQRALVWCNTEGEEKFFSFADIARLSNQAANVFLSAGIERGDHVMVVLKRHYEYWIVSIALHKIGAVMLPVTHMLMPEDIVYRLETAKVKGIVCTPYNDVPAHVIEAVTSIDAPCLLWTVQADIEGFVNLTEAIAAADTQLARCETKVTDPMVLYFTSGTTGQPKGVIHDFSYPLAHYVTAKYWQQAEDGGLHFTVAETGWAKASWGKLYGQWLVGSAVMVYDFDNFEPKQLAHIINRYEVTSFCAPPTIYRYLTRKGTPDLPSVRCAVTAGEFLSPDIFERFTRRTGLSLHEGYGQTETALQMANYKGMENVDGSLGKPSPMYHIALQNEDGSDVARGEIGEIVIIPKHEDERPLGVFSGYFDNPDLYDHVWRGGVYHTGDAAWQDEAGYYWFHGRFDDIIKSGGYRIGPSEIEHVLEKHAAVLECSVIGVPDALRGQAIKAFIVLNHGYQASQELEKDIREACNAQLAEYKWLRKIEFVEEMPKTISGKIRKSALKHASK